MTSFAIRIIALAAGALAVAIGGFVYWRSTEQPAAVATAPEPPPGRSEPAAPATPAPQPSAALPQLAPTAPQGAVVAAAKPPEFDVVRVSPSGETVVAGRAPNAARVELLDNGKVIAGENVDESGQFVLLPPALSPGDHSLALRITPEGQTPLTSAQNVAVGVRPGSSPVVTLAEPGKPSVVLAAPANAEPGKKPSETAAAPPSGQVSVRTAEVEAGGRFFATGTAPPGSVVRLYLNGSHVADASTASDGKWSLTITKGVTGGKYALRADAVDAAGKVTSRAEVPFDAPVALAAAAPGPTQPGSSTSAPAPGPAPAPSPQATSSGASLRPANANEPEKASASAAEAGSDTLPGGVPTTPSQGAASQGAAPQSSPRAPAAPQTASAAEPHGTASPASNDATANPVVPEISTATVTRGDSLWRISRLRWGKGMRYTVIYEANASQIRNPHLIYPGQVLVMPQN